MIQGMIIGNVNTAPARKLELAALFLPRIDNWSVCDSFCSGLKFAREESNKQLVWDFIDPLFDNNGEYYVRFAAVMALNYYTDNEYISAVLKNYSSVKHEGYYAQMAVSWGIAEAFAKNPVITTEFIKDNYIDNFTYNKALQKIRESFRVKKEDKDVLKNLILG
jgi:3-methyladenine DNA glycosylase AlkD